MSDGTKFDANVKIAWGTENDDYPGCRLIKQDVTGQTQNENKKPNDPPAFLIRVWEEIDEENETPVGNADITYDQYNNKIVTQTWIQFSTGSLENQTIGITAAEAPNTDAILKEQIETDDGTLRQIKRVYTTGGILEDRQNLRFGGKVIVRTITSLNEIPATPTGFTLVGPGITFVRGLQLYVYEYAAASGGGTPGTSGQISQGFTNNQGGNVAFNPASPTSATGEVICTTTWVSPQSTTSNPVTQPSGFVLWSVDVQEDSGYKTWITKSSFAGGLATSKDTDGGRDGSITYTVTQNDDDGSLVPAYPGTGTAYNTKLTHTRDNGFFKNMAIWVKPPDTVTLKQTTQFEKPGSAVFTGSPPQLVITAPATLTILADMEVSYGTSQITDLPFTVKQPATFYESYTPTDTGIAVTSTQALGRYLAGASGISGTNSVYNGILCDTWSATLGSSTPSSFSLDTKVIKTDNEIYLTDVSGVVVFRRTKISYDFS